MNMGQTQVIETKEYIRYIGKLPDGSYGVALQAKYVHNIKRKLKKTKARLAAEWE